MLNLWTTIIINKYLLTHNYKLPWRHLHQIQGNWVGRNFITTSRVNSQLITHARMQRWIWNLQQPQIQLSSNWFINVILGYPFLYIAKKNILCIKIITVSQSKGSTVFCKLELYALSKKTALKISLNPGLNLTIFLGTGPCTLNPY